MLNRPVDRRKNQDREGRTGAEMIMSQDNNQPGIRKSEVETMTRTELSHSLRIKN